MPNVPEWSDLSGALEGDPAARYRVYVVEVVKYLEHYRPIAPGAYQGAAVDLGTLSGLDLKAFGLWRRAVVRVELVMEKRLRALGGALAQIRALGQAPTAPVGWVEAQQHRSMLERHLRTVWRLEPPSVAEDVRAWARKHARRLDLLPDAWRQL